MHVEFIAIIAAATPLGFRSAHAAAGGPTPVSSMPGTVAGDLRMWTGASQHATHRAEQPSDSGCCSVTSERCRLKLVTLHWVTVRSRFHPYSMQQLGSVWSELGLIQSVQPNPAVPNVVENKGFLIPPMNESVAVKAVS